MKGSYILVGRIQRALSNYFNTLDFRVGLVKNLRFGTIQRLIFGLLDGLLPLGIGEKYAHFPAILSIIKLESIVFVLECDTLFFITMAFFSFKMCPSLE